MSRRAGGSSVHSFLRNHCGLLLLEKLMAVLGFDKMSRFRLSKRCVYERSKENHESKKRKEKKRKEPKHAEVKKKSLLDTS